MMLEKVITISVIAVLLGITAMAGNNAFETAEDFAQAQSGVYEAIQNGDEDAVEEAYEQLEQIEEDIDVEAKLDELEEKAEELEEEADELKEELDEDEKEEIEEELKGLF